MKDLIEIKYEGRILSVNRTGNMEGGIRGEK
jgi:hypothetical protein